MSYIKIYIGKYYFKKPIAYTLMHVVTYHTTAYYPRHYFFVNNNYGSGIVNPEIKYYE